MSQLFALSREDLDRFEQAARAATQGEWQVGHTNTPTVDAAVDFMADTIRKRESPDLWMTFIGDAEAGEVLCTAYTGNGPTSEANADYLVVAQPRNMLLLVAALRHFLGDREVVELPWPEGVAFEPAE